MAGKQVQRRRGTSVEHLTWIGAPGEVTVDSVKHTQVVHDGVTPGGHPLATEANLALTNTAVATAQATADDATTLAGQAIDDANDALVATGDLVYKADLRTSNTYTGVGLRFQADFSSGTGAFANRYIFQTSTVDGVSMLTAMPNGAGAGSGANFFSSADLENSPLLGISINAGGCVVGANRTGTGAFLPLALHTSGLPRLRIAVDGTTLVASDNTYFGTLKLCSVDFASYVRTLRVDNGNNLQLVNQAGTTATHSFGNTGDLTAIGQIRATGDLATSANLSVTGTGFMAGLSVSGNASTGGTHSVTGDMYSTGTVRCTSGTAGGEARIYRVRDGAQATAVFQETEVGIAVACAYLISSGLRTFGPQSDGAVYCGWSYARWAQIYAVTGAINTSDQREKTELRVFNAAEMAVAKSLAADIGMYQWLSAVDEKGEDARLHTGMIAQQVQVRFTEQGLDAHRYGLFCYDECEDMPAILSEDGEVLTEPREAGNRYGLRYDELSQFILRGMAENQRLLEARIAALEAA